MTFPFAKPFFFRDGLEEGDLDGEEERICQSIFKMYFKTDFWSASWYLNENVKKTHLTLSILWSNVQLQ